VSDPDGGRDSTGAVHQRETKGIAAITAPDPLTLIIKTSTPYPLLPLDMAVPGILSASFHGAGPDLAFKQGGCPGLGTPPKSVDFDRPGQCGGHRPLQARRIHPPDAHPAGAAQG